MSNFAYAESISFSKRRLETRRQISSINSENSNISQDQAKECALEFIKDHPVAFTSVFSTYGVESITFEVQLTDSKLKITSFTVQTSNGKILSHTLDNRGNIHLNEPLPQKVGAAMKKMFSGFPFLQLEDVGKATKNFIEITTFKTFFILLGTIYTLILGSFTTLHWVLFIVTLAHSVLRHMANRYKGTDDYVHFSRNIQLFMWPYMLLAVSNVLSNIIAINVLPEGTFIAVITSGIIYAELKGMLENAEACNLPVPPLLRRMTKNKKDNDFPL